MFRKGFWLALKLYMLMFKQYWLFQYMSHLETLNLKGGEYDFIKLYELEIYNCDD